MKKRTVFFMFGLAIVLGIFVVKKCSKSQRELRRKKKVLEAAGFEH